MKKLPKNMIASILIVDDETTTLNVLERMLRKREDYDVTTFSCGERALSAAQEDPPDLVLLDVFMPGMDGSEFFRRLKSDKKLEGIPVIFLSVLADPLDKVKIFELGASDYITKPLCELTVLAKVKNHLDLRRHQLHMEQQIRSRSEQLAEAHRRLQIWDNAKNDWLQVLSHEMRTPLTGIFGAADYVFSELPADSPLLDFQYEYEISRERMLKLIDDALLLTYIDADTDSYRMIPIDLDMVIGEALAKLEKNSVKAELLPGMQQIKDAVVMAEPSLLFRAISDVLKTVSICVLSGESMSLDAAFADGEIHLFIHTDGPRLSTEALNAFFEVGGQRMLLTAGGDFGLGLALAARIIDLLKGSVSVQNRPHRGIVIKMSLPLVEEHSSVWREEAILLPSDTAGRGGARNESI